MAKKLKFYLITAFMTVVIIEVVSFFTLKSLYPEQKIKSDFNHWGQSQLTLNAWNLSFKAHPFFGFICDEMILDSVCNNHGFMSRYNFPIEKEEGQKIVGIFGGSVAAGIGSRLESFQDFYDKKAKTKNKLKFVNLALGGYRQPQTFYVLTYFLEMVDAVVVIDGANELSENPYPKYPLDYPKLTQRFFDDPGLDKKSKEKIQRLRGRYNKLSKIFYQTPLKYSQVFKLLYLAFEDYAKERVETLSREMTATKDVKSQFYPELLNQEEYDSKLLNYWFKYALLSKAVSEENKKPYYHFLQPSQYVKNSKIFSESEKKIAISTSDSRKKYALRMQKLSEALSSKKIKNFYDVTRLYSDIKMPIYTDNFCHINQKGEELLIDKIIEVINSEMRL